MANAVISPRLLSLAEWNSLDVSERETWELVDGSVLVSPKPTPFHSTATNVLWLLLRSAVICSGGGRAGPQWAVVTEVEVALDDAPATVRAPDVVLVQKNAYLQNPQNFTPQQVGLVVEVVSPGSRRTDYVAKRYDYELARIPFYWIIDPDQQRVTCLQLSDDHYLERPVESSEVVHLTEPVEISFSWSDLS